MSVVIWANNATSTLAGPLSNSATSLTLTSGNGSLFPQPTAGQFFPLILASANSPTNLALREIVYVSSRSGDTLSGLQRAQEGTSALAFNAGDTASNLLTAGTIGLFQQSAAHGMQVFSTTGTFTVPAGVYGLDVEVWGAGGGGGGSNGFTSAASSGGGGGYCRAYLTATPGSVITATVGTGGAGGNGNPTNGVAGTASTFSSLTANGGGGGSGASGGVQETSYGLGGIATGGTINSAGGNGGFGIALGTNGTLSSIGGAAGYGFSAPAYSLTQTTAIPGNNGAPGCGGNGGILGASGGTGGNGLIIVRW